VFVKRNRMISDPWIKSFRSSHKSLQSINPLRTRSCDGQTDKVRTIASFPQGKCAKNESAVTRSNKIGWANSSYSVASINTHFSISIWDVQLKVTKSNVLSVDFNHFYLLSNLKGTWFPLVFFLFGLLCGDFLVAQ
jgi:hypothetical protein